MENDLDSTLLEKVGPWMVVMVVAAFIAAICGIGYSAEKDGITHTVLGIVSLVSYAMVPISLIVIIRKFPADPKAP